MIRKLNYQEIEGIAKKHRDLIFKENALYYGFMEDNRIVSIISLVEKATSVKLKANYTLPEYRGRGYFTALLKFVLERTDKRVLADCLDMSLGIYLKNGFIVKREKQFKHFKITYVERLGYCLSKESATLGQIGAEKELVNA
jgi:GNAT superfamily N-acetyltransferase